MTDVHIRWMLRADLGPILGIESIQFDHPWQEDDFLRCLRTHNCIGMVAQLGGPKPGGRIVGYMLYELHSNRLHLLNLAVAPDLMRSGVGRQMIDKLKGKLSLERRSRILCEVRETNMAAQVFLRAMGFRWRETMREFYRDCDEDAYVFVYRLPGKPRPSTLAEDIEEGAIFEVGDLAHAETPPLDKGTR